MYEDRVRCSEQSVGLNGVRNIFGGLLSGQSFMAVKNRISADQFRLW
jgi:acyl-CoA thioesterase